MKNKTLKLWWTIYTLVVLAPLDLHADFDWNIKFNDNYGNLEIIAEPGRAFDLMESSDLKTWKRSAGWPKIADGHVINHYFEKDVSGFFQITPTAQGFQYPPESFQYLKSVPQISPGRLVALSKFFLGLDNIGLKNHFLDGGCYRIDSQNSEGHILYSFKGMTDLSIVGDHKFCKNGILFQGGEGYANGSMPIQSGARTLIGFHTGSLDNDINEDIPIFQLRGSSWAHFNINQSGINGQISQYAGSGSARFIMASGWNRMTPYMVAVVAKDDGLELTESYQHRAYPAGHLPAGNIGSESGVSNFEVNQMRLCVSANNDLSKIWGTAERLINGWLLFDVSLTHLQEKQVVDLAYQTLFPKYRWIWEGDSITRDIQLRYADKGDFQGGNREHINRWSGGQTSTDGVEQLGSGGYVLPWNESTQRHLGICDEIATNDHPVFCWIGFGANDLGRTTTPVSSILENMRTIAAYAKSRSMIVVVPTVTKGWAIVDNGRESDRAELNHLLKNDAGIHFDYVIDVDAKFRELSGDDYHLDPRYFRDELHYSLSAGGGADVAATLLESIIKNVLP